MPTPAFDQIQAALTSHGPEAALEQAAAYFREQKRYHDLFEIRKMQTRRRIGLPLQYTDAGDTLSDAQRDSLETGLLAACREVGTLLLQDRKVREGWMYLRPVGDKAEAAGLLAAIEPDEDLLDELVEVLLHEGIDIGRGFGLVLSHYGVCNSITTYDQAIARRSRSEQQPAAALLLHRVHADLMANVKTDIARQEGRQPTETNLAALVADREWLFQGNSYHLDTTHLASTIRIARVLTNPADWPLALDLTEYGRRLNEQFQYPGDEPFTETYPASALYFSALLGERVDEALAYFRQKAEMLDAQFHGLAAVETYVDLLARLGRHDEALAAALTLSKPNAQSSGLGPTLMDLAGQSGSYQRVADHCREKGDLLGFTTAIVQSADRQSG